MVIYGLKKVVLPVYLICEKPSTINPLEWMSHNTGQSLVPSGFPPLFHAVAAAGVEFLS